AKGKPSQFTQLKDNKVRSGYPDETDGTACQRSDIYMEYWHVFLFQSLQTDLIQRRFHLA
ncbi:hypothetical protein ACS2QQ_29635, partial [Bacillus cereus group sp. Bce032]|uniref:hypothetical protein n=1 Tax=Bacillus cereus group sp. Bce032 TaxID=3445236 RepID=UPI003F2807DD